MRMSIERARELGLLTCKEDCEVCVCFIADKNSCDENGMSIPAMMKEGIGCPLLNEGRLRDEMTEEEYDAYRHNKLEIYDIIACGIEWDGDEEDDTIELPDEIEIPTGITDEEEISDYISDITGFCHYGFNVKKVYLMFSNHITYDDIDIAGKLGNMLDCEISQEVYNKCMEAEAQEKIKDKVWELINDNSSAFSKTSFYEGLAKEHEAVDDHDMWAACLYNCDLLYMTAIAHVLNLETPKSAGDTQIFGISY